MEDFETLTKILRKELINKYRNFYDNCSENDYDNYTNYEEDECDNIDFENYIEEEYDNDFCEDQEFDDAYYDEKILDKIVDFIINSKYKNIFKLIILNDAYEYIKPREISETPLYQYEKEILDKLENDDLNELLDKINYSQNFFKDLVSIFLEYNEADFIEEDKIKNKKLLELSNNLNNLKKFNICILDDIQFQYKKTRKIF